MKSFSVVSFLLAVPLLLVSAAPLDMVEFTRRTGDSCTCNGRQYNNVWNQRHDPARFLNFEKIHFARCPKPMKMKRYILNGHGSDHAVYSGDHFCGCITHDGAATENEFVAC